MGAVGYLAYRMRHAMAGVWACVRPTASPVVPPEAIDMWKLALVGVVALWVVIWLLNAPAMPRRILKSYCGQWSPDDRYRCVESLAHNGWCRNGQVSWRGSAWATGASDDTCFAAEPQVVTEQLTPPPIKRRRLPRSLIFLGVVAVMFVWNYEYDTNHPPPTPKQLQCEDMDAIYRCTHWSEK
jgi:hypothetical protein